MKCEWPSLSGSVLVVEMLEIAFSRSKQSVLEVSQPITSCQIFCPLKQIGRQGLCFLWIVNAEVCLLSWGMKWDGGKIKNCQRKLDRSPQAPLHLYKEWHQSLLNRWKSIGFFFFLTALQWQDCATWSSPHQISLQQFAAGTFFFASNPRALTPLIPFPSRCSSAQRQRHSYWIFLTYLKAGIQ